MWEYTNKNRVEKEKIPILNQLYLEAIGNVSKTSQLSANQRDYLTREDAINSPVAIFAWGLVRNASYLHLLCVVDAEDNAYIGGHVVNDELDGEFVEDIVGRPDEENK